VNYYDELGLAPEASSEQIHQAYRALARLLHPDQVSDEKLKRIAECQLKRLNELHATLSDPERRAAYDASLSGTPKQSLNRKISGREIGFLAAGFCLATAIFHWTGKPDAGPPPASSVQVQTPAPRIAASSAPRFLSNPARAAQPRSRDSFRKSGELLQPAAVPAPATPGPEHEIDSPPASPPSAIQASISLPSIELQAPPANADGPLSGLAGIWIYSRQKPATPDNSAYTADYVEAVITQEGEFLRGRYRARYRVTDQPISPEVAFNFEGRISSAESVVLNWIGAHGARGEVTLTLIAPDSLRIDWLTTALGAKPALVSGSAVLKRRQNL